MASAKCEAQAQLFNMLQTWQSELNLLKVIENERWERKTSNKEEKKWQWLREGLEPATWQMACHALTNWATKSFGNSVVKFHYLRSSCQGSSWSGYQAAMFDGESMVNAKCKAQGQLFNMLQTWQSDHNLAKVNENERWKIMTWKKEGTKWQSRGGRADFTFYIGQLENAGVQGCFNSFVLSVNNMWLWNIRESRSL